MSSARLRHEAENLGGVQLLLARSLGRHVALPLSRGGHGFLNHPRGQHALLLLGGALQRDLVQTGSCRATWFLWRLQHLLLCVSTLDPVCHRSPRFLQEMLVAGTNNERNLLDKEVLDLMKSQRTPDFPPQSGHAAEKSRRVLRIVKHEVGVQVSGRKVVGTERSKNIPTRAAGLLAAVWRSRRLVEVSHAKPATKSNGLVLLHCLVRHNLVLQSVLARLWCGDVRGCAGDAPGMCVVFWEAPEKLPSTGFILGVDFGLWGECAGRDVQGM